MFNKKLIQVLKNTINNLEDDLSKQKEELRKEKEKNEIYQKDLIIVLENSEEQRRKIKDLENNVEFLYNNLSAQKKKLFRAEN
jgi:hypothetical protein